jgi:hypothetical protein
MCGGVKEMMFNDFTLHISSFICECMGVKEMLFSNFTLHIFSIICEFVGVKEMMFSDFITWDMMNGWGEIGSTL